MITVERAGANDLVIDLGRGVPTAMGCDFAIRAADGTQLGPDGWGETAHLFRPSGLIKGERTRLVTPAAPFAALNPGDGVTLEIPAASYRSSFVWPALPAPLPFSTSTASAEPAPASAPPPPRRVDVLAPPSLAVSHSTARNALAALAAAAIVITAGALGFWAARLNATAAALEQERLANATRAGELASATAALGAQTSQLENRQRELTAALARLARERQDFDRLRQNAGAELRELDVGRRALAADKEQFEKTRLEFLDERAKWRQERDASPREAAAPTPLPSPSLSSPATAVAIAVDSSGRWELSQRPSLYEAREEALRRCAYRGSGCQVSDLQACVAFSRSARGWSYAFGATIDEARRVAAARCNQNFGSCAVLRDDEYCR